MGAPGAPAFSTLRQLDEKLARNFAVIVALAAAGVACTVSEVSSHRA